MEGTVSLVCPEERESGDYDFFIFVFVSCGHCSVMIRGKRNAWITLGVFKSFQD